MSCITTQLTIFIKFRMSVIEDRNNDYYVMHYHTANDIYKVQNVVYRRQ